MGLLGPPRRFLLGAVASWVLLSTPPPALAEEESAAADAIPDLGAPPSAAMRALFGKPVTRIRVVTRGGRWDAPVTLRRVRVGETLTAQLARRAISELSDSGRYGELRVDAEPDGDGAALVLTVLPRRIVASLRVVGGKLEGDDTERAAGISPGDELTAPALLACAERVRAFYAGSGYAHATVAADTIDTDDPMRVVVLLHVVAGAPRVVTSRVFHVAPNPSARVKELLSQYEVQVGDRLDDEALSRADREEQDVLRRAGFHVAELSHETTAQGDGGAVAITVRTGPLVHIRFEGNRHFDESDLEAALELDSSDDRSPGTLAARIQKFYVDHGFFDAKVTPGVRGKETDTENDLVLGVREGVVVRVALREYPCLGGERTADDVGEEIDSFLSEALPGTGFVGSVNPAVVDSALGPRGATGARVTPEDQNPWRTYVPDVYDRATRHLQELYRSEGYLSASVGPVVLMRRTCERRSPAGECTPIGARIRPPVLCPAPGRLPEGDPPATPACVPDLRKGIRCEAEVALHIPVKLGPRAVLWDAAFEGNVVLTEAELLKLAELPLGSPVSQAELENARRRLMDEYAERGFAFATVELRTDLSPDCTRARARFLISEHEQVRVKDVIVRGAERTNEGLILGRVAFEKGDIYRRSAVRATEERLATLGVFSSVTVTLEDPDVPAKEKVAVITVRERPPQYLDIRPGLSTGDGVRVLFEYGHRNLGGHAIKLTFRVQLGYLPDFLIFESQVRERFDQLSLLDRLERRNSASVEFPEVGLGPLFPFGVDLIDVRDNSRDFGLTKDASIVTLSYRPTTRFVTQLGGSLELNDATIFAYTGNDASVQTYLQSNPAAATRLRVPDGKTYAVAERTNVTWDRRDNPFDATRGTFLSAGVEHVRAAPADSSATATSDFLRLTSRVAGYARLSKKGLALALSFRWGYNVQLKHDSQTYPDRLFYAGGADSIRGFIQDSLIPEDIAQQIFADQRKIGQPGVTAANTLTPDKVPVRGGNVLLNPRAELRIPLGGVFQTALFLDTGNLWLYSGTVDPTKLRYAAGTGLRASTPVGPLALDIGMNLARRYWEDPFAFHFSIGLF